MYFIVRQHQHIPIHQQKQPTSRSGQIPGNEMDRLYPDCEFVVAGPLNGSYIFDVADGEICKKPEKVKYVLLESGMSAEDTAELIAQQKPDIAVAIASGAVPFDWVPIKTALIAEELQKKRNCNHCQ